MRFAEEARYLVLAAQLEGRRQLSQQLRPLGLTPSQAEVIRVLADYGPLTLNGLGRLLVCESGSSPSRLVDRLVDRGLVGRQTSSADRRQVELTLTAQGAELAREVAAVEDAVYAAIDASATADAPAGLEFLRAYVAGSPTGEALSRRREGPQPVNNLIGNQS